MRIEVGKRYINAEGKITEITRFDGGCIYYDFFNNKYEYNGRVSLLVESNKDLICEAVTDIITAWRDVYIETWKDVLQAHFDKWAYQNER